MTLERVPSAGDDQHRGPGATSAPRHSVTPALLATLIGLLLLTVRLIYDLDFGFHLATGRHVMEHGLPRREFLAPLLADTPLASTFVLGSLAITAAWMIAGAAGLVALKAACYTGAFVIAADAARRRAPTWPMLAAALAIGCAASAAPRLVERPGMFSALGLAGVVWLAATCVEKLRAPSWWMIGVGAAASTVWSWTHPEWLLGIAAFALLIGTRVPLRVAAQWMLAVVAVPLCVYAIAHPMGIEAWWWVIEQPAGKARLVGNSEYSAANWTIMPAAPAIVIGALVLSIARARQRAWGEAALLALLAATCVSSPRGILPLVIVAVPPATEALAALFDYFLKSRRVLIDRAMAVAVVAALVACVVAMPWRPFGAGLHPQLDARGVGLFLDTTGDGFGPIAGDYGGASLLLSQPGAARTGIVMDGRLESYPADYITSVALPSTSGDADAQAAHLAAIGAAFYYEMYPRRGAASRLDGLRARGWRLVVWDNAGRLLARPGLAEQQGWRALDIDPADDTIIARDEAGLVAALAELSIVCDELEEAGIASGRGRLAQASVAVRLGRDDVVNYALNIAGGDHLDGSIRYLATIAEDYTARGDRERFLITCKRIEYAGRVDLAQALKRQWTHRHGGMPSSKNLTPETD